MIDDPNRIPDLPPDNCAIETHPLRTLHGVKQRVEMNLRKAGLRDMTVEVFDKVMENYLSVEMRRYVASEHMPVVRVPSSHPISGEMQSWPKNWWEAFKHRWFPQWLLKCFPVKWATYQFRETVQLVHTISFDVIYPDFALPSPDAGRTVMIPRDGFKTERVQTSFLASDLSGKPAGQQEPELSSREKHLAWCKQRAKRYLDQGDAAQASSSFASDMMKHQDTALQLTEIAKRELLYAASMGSEQLRRTIDLFQ